MPPANITIRSARQRSTAVSSLVKFGAMVKKKQTRIGAMYVEKTIYIGN